MNYKTHTVVFGVLFVVVFMGNVFMSNVDKYGAETGPQTTRSNFNTAADTNPSIPEVPQVASRYHLRNRAARSIKSAAGTQLASRYHLRNRATQSFKSPAGTQLASRYHLRNRTASFFERATDLARVSHGKGMPSGELHEAMTADQQQLQLA